MILFKSATNRNVCLSSQQRDQNHLVTTFRCTKQRDLQLKAVYTVIRKPHFIYCSSHSVHYKSTSKLKVNYLIFPSTLTVFFWWKLLSFLFWVLFVSNLKKKKKKRCSKMILLYYTAFLILLCKNSVVCVPLVY